MPQPQEPRPGPAIAEDEALALARAGEARGFEAIMRRHNQRLYRICRSVLHNPAEAEDALQETWVRALTRLGQLETPAGLGAWLGRIALNESLGRYRRERRAGADGAQHGSAGSAPERLADPAPTPEHNVTTEEIRRLIEAAVDRLPEDFRTAFVLREVEELSVAETAALLDIPPDTVKTRTWRARRLLQARLREQLAGVLPEVFPFAGARCDGMVAAVLLRLGLTHPPHPGPH